jgi:hypothetical protein
VKKTASNVQAQMADLWKLVGFLKSSTKICSLTAFDIFLFEASNDSRHEWPSGDLCPLLLIWMKRKISIFYFKNRILLFESEDDEIMFIKIK